MKTIINNHIINNHKHPGSLLAILHTLSHLIFTATDRKTATITPMFTEEETITEAKYRSKGQQLRST